MKKIIPPFKESPFKMPKPESGQEKPQRPKFDRTNINPPPKKDK